MSHSSAENATELQNSRPSTPASQGSSSPAADAAAPHEDTASTPAGPGDIGFILPSMRSSSVDDAALCNLIVNYMPPLMDEAAAYQLFSQFGPIFSVKIIYDKETRESRGYGFVRYECFFSATYAITYLNRYEIAGKKLKVAYADLSAAKKALELLKDHRDEGFTERQKLIVHELYLQQLAAQYAQQQQQQ